MIAVEGFVISSPFVSSLHQHPADALIRISMAKDSKLPSDNGSSDSSSSDPSDLSWLRKAMDSSEVLEPDGLVLVDSKPGISGFAVDPGRGFVAVMVGGDRAIYTVVSPRDKTDVRSAEALTLVQLSGGLDLGTPILPPDILARLVADEMETADVREMRPKVKLLRVDVVPSPYYGSFAEEDTKDTSSVTATPQSTPERDANIESQAAKVLEAVNKLPGLNGEASLEQVEVGLRLHADESGQLDRDGFMALLDTLRNEINVMEPSKVKFKLLVSVNDDDGGNERELEIAAPSAVVAIGLALRYKVEVVVSEECQVEGFDVMEIPSRFPNFRPIQQLYEDAKIMDGFIPSMFSRHKAPDNDDKVV